MGGQRDTEITARVRAVWGFSGLSQNAFAKAAGINPGTFRGYVRHADPKIPPQEVRAALARAAGVPVDFMEAGFSEPESALAVQVGEIQRRLDAVAVLLPILLEQSDAEKRLPAAGSRALEQVLDRRGPEDRRRPA